MKVKLTHLRCQGSKLLDNLKLTLGNLLLDHKHLFQQVQDLGIPLGLRLVPDRLPRPGLSVWTSGVSVGASGLGGAQRHGSRCDVLVITCSEDD